MPTADSTSRRAGETRRPVSNSPVAPSYSLTRKAPAPQGRTSAPAPAPAPAQQSTTSVPSYSGSDGYRSGGGGGAPAAVAAPPPPTPIRDVDWFESDGIYRGQAGRALTDLTSKLGQILADRDAGYRQLDLARDEIGRGRQEDLTGAGDDFAGRGLLNSGLFAQSADRIAADYTRQGNALDETGLKLGQQYGQRNSIVDLGGLNANSNLASIYGLLGSLGVGAGNEYNGALSRARAESAQRATAPLVQTTTW